MTGRQGDKERPITPDWILDTGYWILDSERIGGKVLRGVNLQIVGRVEAETFLPVVMRT